MPSSVRRRSTTAIMIEYLRGTLLKKENGHLIVDVNGVGYGVDVPLTVFHTLPEVGQAVEFQIYFHVTASQGGAAGFSLYGFVAERDREMFEVLLSAQGIGPSKAVDIMSAISSDDLARAILQGDLAQLGRLKGIGKKTAEKLIVILREKMKRFTLMHGIGETAPAAGASETGKRRAVPGGQTSGAAALREAVEALEALGVKPLIAERAAQKALEVLGPEATVADLIKEGLKHRK